MSIFNKPKFAFCFTGGGSRGAVQIGMLKEFVKSGVLPVAVSGSSVGSLNAAYYASNPTIEGVMELENIWLGMRESVIFPNNTSDLIKGIFSNNYTVSNAGLIELIEKVKIRNIEDSKIPLYINTTLLQNGDNVVHSQGKLAEILLASCAIPGLFSPVLIKGELHIDGGVSYIAPISPLKLHRPKKIYVFDSTGPTHNPKQKTALDILKTGFNYSNRSQIMNLDTDNKVKVISLPSSSYTKDSRNFENTSTLIREGELIAREILGRDER